MNGPGMTRNMMRALAAVLAVLLSALVLPGLTRAEEAVPETRNMARVATASASFTAGHNSLEAIHDGAHSNSGPPETSYWGTWTATGRPASQHLQYDWIDPVQVERSVISFWTDAAPGTGENVTIPQSWSIDYWDLTDATWKPVPAPSGYGTSRTGTNVTTFDPVVTTKLRANFQTYPNAAETLYSALGVSEWEVWGGIAESDPDTVIDVPAVHVRTTPGVAPALPEALDVVRLGGHLTSVPVTWESVADNELVNDTMVELAGDLEGLDESARATVWVRESPSSTIEQVDDASVITTVGVRPVLPSSVVATYADGSRDSGVAVAWAPLDRADYAAESFFEVAGDVSGADLAVVAWVFVEPADGTEPTPAFSLSTEPGEPTGSNGWFRGDVSVVVDPVDGALGSYEFRIDDGAWTPVVDGAVPVTGDAIHDVTVRETGATATQSLEVRVDSTAPVSTATVDDGSRTVTLSATDETSGVQRVEYRLDDGAWSPYSEPVALNAGAVTVAYRALDAADNEEVARSVQVPPAEKALTTTTASPASQKVSYGKTARIQVTVASSAGTPTGDVVVREGSVIVGSATLSGGTVQINLVSTLKIGRHSLTVDYQGSAAYSPSSAVVTVTVVKATKN